MSENVIQLNPKNMLDKPQFEHWFNTYYDGMFRYCMTMVKDRDEAEDIIQSVFTYLWQERHKTEIHTSIQAFLYKSVYFKCMNRIKREKVNQKYISSQSLDGQNIMDSNPAILLEVSLKINEGIAALPDQCRKIFSMSRYDGMKYQDIADQLQLSIKTIENQMGKALKSLRIHLADYLQAIIFNLITFL